LNKLPFCCNFSLGLVTKVRACEGAGQEWSRESHFMLLGVWEAMREWTPTLPNELPLGKLDFGWTFEYSESDCRGQNPLDQRVLYIIEKILERRCLKWARMTHKSSTQVNWNGRALVLAKIGSISMHSITLYEQEWLSLFSIQHGSTYQISTYSKVNNSIGITLNVVNMRLQWQCSQKLG
jgi:hypothetical protein